MPSLNYDRAVELLTYSPATGEFHWREDVRGGFKRSVLMRRSGDLAGTRRRDGRRVLRLDGVLYLGYRVAWLLQTGEWPAGEIDHIDGDATNDRWLNLRSVQRTVNQQNQRRAQKNKSSCRLLGVYANPRNATSPWKAAISTNKKQFYLGVFATQEKAHEAYIEAKRRLHEGCTI